MGLFVVEVLGEGFDELVDFGEEVGGGRGVEEGLEGLQVGGDLGVFGFEVVDGGFQLRVPVEQAGEQAAGLDGVVDVQALAQGQAVDPELSAEAWARGRDLAADQGEFVAESAVDRPECVAEGAAVRRSAGYLHESDDRDDASGVGLVLAPAGVRLDQAGEDLVALGVPEYDGFCFVGEGAGLDRGERVGQQVVVPIWLLRATTCGTDDEEPVVGVGVIPQYCGVRGAGTCARGRQEEQSRPVERAADPAGVGAEFLDDLLREIVQDSLLSLR